VIHVDLMRVNLSERVVVRVPLELRGTAQGTHEGGIVDQNLNHLEVECLVTDIPDLIQVSVKELAWAHDQGRGCGAAGRCGAQDPSGRDGLHLPPAEDYGC